ncbi:MAG TPA: ABC transporter permease [Candidatus Binataceae bacterium]|nr:ABC transporter permease [Candidatus Binataceae bacterium]
MIERLRQLLIKEFIHLFRDPHARIALLAPPLLQILVFGYAATYDVNHVSTAILDQDHSYESRDLISHIEASNRFYISRVLHSESEISHVIDYRQATLVIQIHPGFSEQLRKGAGAAVQAVFDGTDSNTALIAIGYISQIANTYATDYQTQYISHLRPALLEFAPKVTLVERPWYNQNLEGRWFFVPGVIGTIVMTSVIVLTAFAVVREREVGTLEQLMVTPIRPVELILGKTLPTLIVGLANVSMATAVAILWFQVPFRGHLLILALGATLFVASSLGVGLVISTICSTQQQAFASGFFYIMPTIMLSGFGYPISSMPEALQKFTLIDPLRYFLIVIRSTFLKGSGLVELWPQLAAMTILTAATLAIATARFHKTLD